jgi:hypothetical protein
MPWFVYLNDYLIPAEVRAFTIDDAVSAGLSIARELLGSVSHYCLYEGFNEVVIEFWRGDEGAVKLIYSENPTEALMRFYDVEKRRLVRCESVGVVPSLAY